jgi:hypothetical protein
MIDDLDFIRAKMRHGVPLTQQEILILLREVEHESSSRHLVQD